MKTAALAHRQTSGPEPGKGGGARRPFFTVANRAVQAKSEREEVQARLRVGRPGDRFEVEADRVADDVVDGRGAALAGPGLASGVTPLTQRMEQEKAQARAEDEEAQTKGEEEKVQAQEDEEAQAQEEEEVQTQAEEEEEVQAREEDEETQAQDEEEAQAKEEDEEAQAQQEEEEEAVQARPMRGGGLAVSEEVSRQVRAARGRGNPLAGPVRAKMETQFGADFSGVRIHTDSLAVRLSAALRAQAFTRGSDIFFNEGKFAPGSRAGEHLLAHELTHTVQQGAVEPDGTDVVRLAPTNDADTYEVRPEIVEAVRLARGEIGKVNAKRTGGDGKRIGWERLREYFATAFGGPVIHELVIDRVKWQGKDTLPSWCGIFTWWAMKKAGIPIPDWKLGAPALDAMKPRARGELPRKGDIALDVLPYNHFAMVSGLESTKDAEGKPRKLTRIATINGNTAGEDNLGGQVQEKWHSLSHWDHFLDPVGKMNLPDVPLVTVSREPAETEAAATEPAEAKAEPPADSGPRPEVTGLDTAIDAPAPEAFGVPLPEPDLSLPPPVDPGPSEAVAEIGKADLGGTSDQAATAFIDATPSSMAATQPELGPVVDGKMKGEQTELAENPPVLEAKTSGAVDAPITGPDDLPIPGGVELDDGVKGADPGAVDTVSGPAPTPFRGNSDRERELEKEDSGSFLDAFKSFLRRFTSGIRTKDNIDTSAGDRPQVALEGKADTARMDTQREDGTVALKARRDVHTEAFRNHPGQSNIQPRMLDEKRPVAVSPEPAAEIEPQDDTAVRDYALAPLPEDVRGVADAKIAAKLTPNLAGPRSQTTDAATSRDRDKKSKIDIAQQAVATLNTETDIAQRKLVVDNRGRVARLQGEGIGTSYDHVNAFAKDAAGEQTARRKDIGDHVKSEEGKARDKLADGEKDAEKKKLEGEKEAEAKKKELKKEQEKGSWWDRVKSAIKKAVKAITEAIDWVFTKVRNAVKTLIEKAKNAAIGLINKARDWVVDKLDKFRDWAKSKVDKYLKDSFPGLARRINAGIDAVADTAIKGVNAVADAAIKGVTALADGLAKALDKILATFQTALKTAVRVVGAVLQGDFAEALRAAIEGACEIAGIDPKPVFDFLDRAGKAIMSILKEPVKFVKSLFGAVGDGLKSFWKNIKDHMIKGVIAWLTGAMSEVNLTGPFEFTPKGILKIVLEILGLTYANIKAKVIKRYPKAAKAFALIEKGAEAIGKGMAVVRKLFTEGPGALWELVTSAVAKLKETVMGAIRNFIITTVIREGFFWLLSLTNPASALVKALKLVFDLVMFLIERIEQIKDFIMSVYNAVAAIATGNFTKVTTAVENALARAIPVMISLVASVFGLGNIAKQVKGVIATVTKPINRVINKLVDRIVKFAKKVMKKLRAGAKKVKEKAKGAAEAVKAFLWPKKKFAVEGESHTLYFQKKAGQNQPFIRSTPTALDDFVKAWEKRAGPDVSKTKKGHLAAAKATIARIKTLSKEITGLEKAKKPVPKAKQQQMLALQTELSTSLKRLLGTKDDIARAVERYKLEGLTGTFGTIPKPTGDYLTGDHQPQAASIKFLATRPYFKTGAEGAKIRHRAAGSHADNAYVVNLQGKRHMAGRTYGSKGSATKRAFEVAVKTMEGAEPDAPKRRSKAVGLLKKELSQDVAAMRTVYRRKAADDVWKDLDPFTSGDAKAKSKLVTQIRGQVKRGEDILAAQPMNELAG